MKNQRVVVLRRILRMHTGALWSMIDDSRVEVLKLMLHNSYSCSVASRASELQSSLLCLCYQLSPLLSAGLRLRVLEEVLSSPHMLLPSFFSLLFFLPSIFIFLGSSDCKDFWEVCLSDTAVNKVLFLLPGPLHIGVQGVIWQGWMDKGCE